MGATPAYHYLQVQTTGGRIRSRDTENAATLEGWRHTCKNYHQAKTILVPTDSGTLYVNTAHILWMRLVSHNGGGLYDQDAEEGS